KTARRSSSATASCKTTIATITPRHWANEAVFATRLGRVAVAIIVVRNSCGSSKRLREQAAHVGGGDDSGQLALVQDERAVYSALCHLADDVVEPIAKIDDVRIRLANLPHGDARGDEPGLQLSCDAHVTARDQANDGAIVDDREVLEVVLVHHGAGLEYARGSAHEIRERSEE